MKGFAAFATLVAIGGFYVSQKGYDHYIDNLGKITYVAKEGVTSAIQTADALQGRLAQNQTSTSTVETRKVQEAIIPPAPLPLVITHVATPEHVRAVYMSSWVAGSPSFRNKIVALIDRTEVNAVVIDVKDNTGVLTWDSRAKDIAYFIKELHDKNIYVIARVAAFQDPLYVKAHPDQAVHSKKTGDVWHDHKGVPWVDTGSKAMWDYLVTVSKDAHAKGFDEINLDYIRFPTDGLLSDMTFPASGDRAKTDKQGIVRDFYKYITTELHKDNIPVSGDLFGIIMITKVDIPTLGQDLHDALTTFDYVAPMVYPSHFYKGTAGYDNPAAHPGEVISFAMGNALRIAGEVASSTGQATSTFAAKLRPWYQDFDMGATYTKELVRAQIDAGDKLGIMSWMLWDPGNTYTEGALKPQQ